ncbi:MAG: hypothetical protein H6606_03260 [Flavobacteriales bacterium]|nr:hypothetical protein [Flavobacteriales bacterium]
MISELTVAQCTPNDTISRPGYHPPQLPPAYAGESYNEVLQVLVIKDTSIVFNNLPAVVVVDSARLRSVVGLPSGFSFDCYKPTCTFTPKEVGCAVVSGDPALSDTGVYPIGLVIQMFGRVFGAIAIDQTDTLRRFVLDIRSGSASIRAVSGSSFRIFPNPASGGGFYIEGADPIAVSIQTVEGRSIGHIRHGNQIRIHEGFRGFCIVRAELSDGTIAHQRLLVTD